MRTVEIDDGTWNLLLSKISSSSETLSDVVRRLARAEAQDVPASKPDVTLTPALAKPGDNGDCVVDPVTSFLTSAAFLVQGNAVERFLAILSWIHSRDSEGFEKVLLLAGRKRRYFAKSAGDLEASGNSVMPKRIPESPFWVVTNSPTQLKKKILEDVMRVLGYDGFSIRLVLETLR